MTVKKLIYILFVFFVLYNFYYHSHEGEVSIIQGIVSSAYCNKSIKSGTFLKIKYVVDGQSNYATILPTRITCDAFLNQVYMGQRIWIKKQLDPFKRIKAELISIDEQKTYYGFSGVEK